MRDTMRIGSLIALWLVLATTNSWSAEEPVADLAMSEQHRAISRRVLRIAWMAPVI